MTDKEYQEFLESRKGVKYYDHEIEGCGVKIDRENQKAWVKYPDKKELKTDFKKSKIVGDALVYNLPELTKEEYDNYQDKPYNF